MKPTSPEDTTIAQTAQHALFGPTRVADGLNPSLLASELSETLAVRFRSDVTVQLSGELFGPGCVSTAQHRAFRQIALSRGRRRPAATWILKPGNVVRLATGGAVLAALGRGDPFRVDSVDALTSDRLDAELGERRGANRFFGRPVLIVPIAAHAGLLGFLQLTGEVGQQPYPDEAVTMGRWAAELLARTFGTAAPGIGLPGVELFLRKLPASGANVVADWCEALVLDDGRVGLIIGDVAGHDQPAARTRRRYADLARSLAALEMPPEQVLREFDRIADLAADDHLATCVYLVYEPRTRRCLLSNAGHPPPFLVGADGNAGLVDLPSGTPIGVGLRDHERYEIHMPDDSLLTLYTDGLIERRDRDLDRGLAELRAALTRPADSLADVCQDVLGRLLPAVREDDVTLLLARFPPVSPTVSEDATTM